MILGIYIIISLFENFSIPIYKIMQIKKSLMTGSSILFKLYPANELKAPAHYGTAGFQGINEYSYIGNDNDNICPIDKTVYFDILKIPSKS